MRAPIGPQRYLSGVVEVVGPMCIRRVSISGTRLEVIAIGNKVVGPYRCSWVKQMSAMLVSPRSDSAGPVAMSAHVETILIDVGKFRIGLLPCDVLNGGDSGSLHH